MSTNSKKPLSRELEAKCSALALANAHRTARCEAEQDVGTLFLRLRSWHHANPHREIPEVTVIKLAKNVRIDNERKESGYSRRKKKVTRESVSIDEITTNDEGGERLVGYPKQLIEDNSAAERDHADFVRLLKKLPARLRKIIEQRQEGFSLEEIGDSLGVTVERTRQLIDSAIAKMRALAQK